MQPEVETRSRALSILRELVETVFFTLLIYFLVRHFLFENYRVVGNSMLPTLVDDQYLAVDKLSYRLHEPQRGDIVVFRDPRSSNRKLIKRLIGLPGESVEINDGRVFVNGQLLGEPYIAGPGRYSSPETTVPDEHYYVLGDNRNNSSDSHNWGTLSGSLIVGRAWLAYWPPDLWGIVPHEQYGTAP
jgi:signal peptidase I